MKCDQHGRKIYGTTTVNDKGQVVIPADARRDFGIQPDAKLVVFGWGFGSKKALFLMGADDFERRLQGFWGSFFKNAGSGARDETPVPDAK